MIEKTLQLSPMQKGMLFHSLSSLGCGTYNEQVVCELKEQVDLSAFKKAWRNVISRHELLRAAFRYGSGGEPVQEVHSSVEIPFRTVDLTSLPPKEQRLQLRQLACCDRIQDFDLATPPLMRITACKLKSSRYQITWTVHHLLIDVPSIILVLKEVLACYDSMRCGVEPHLEQTTAFSQYVDWTSSLDRSGDRDFWSRKLSGFFGRTPLPVRGGETLSTNSPERFRTIATRLSHEATDDVRALMERENLTLNVLISGLWALLLTRHSGENEVIFGVTKTTRKSGLRRAESVVGPMLVTLPVRVRVDPDAPMMEWLRELRREWISLRKHEHTPLVEMSIAAGISSDSPLFDSLVVFQGQTIDSLLRRGTDSFEHRRFKFLERSHYPLTLAAWADSSLSLELEFDSCRVPLESAKNILTYLRSRLKELVARPLQRISDLAGLSSSERRQLVEGWNDTAREYPSGMCLHELFEEQVEKTPDVAAVIFGFERLSYRELNEKANCLAGHLQARGVGVESRVGLCLDRSMEVTIALLAVMKAGAAYVPLDALYPKQRLAFMIEDAGVSLIVTQKHLADTLPNTIPKFFVDEASYKETAASLQSVEVKPDHLLYILYTSGSTGQPKGVAMPHRAIVNLVAWHNGTLQTGARTLQFAPLTFDASIHEIFAAWCSGGTIFLINEDLRRETSALAWFVAEMQIEKIILPAVILDHLADEFCRGKYKLADLKEVITTGEQLRVTTAVRNFFSGARHCLLHNHYGPTEAHVVTAYTLLGDPSRWPAFPPIGRPIWNTKIFILDEEMEPVPVGVRGEIYIGGAGLARGYVNRPEQTAERFVPNPFGKAGSSLYRTGDLGRYREDGNIEFLGRADDQVKIRGYRVEPKEIEAVIQSHPEVAQALIVAKENAAGDKRLVAYVTARGQARPSATHLSEFVKERLPGYMVPSFFVEIEGLPLTPNGKVDHRALPDPEDIIAQGSTYVAPRTPSEELLCSIWAEVLQLPRVGIFDNFFDLGGHSLRALMIASRIRHQLAADVPIRLLFENPSPHSLSHAIEEWLQGSRSSIGPLQRSSASGH